PRELAREAVETTGVEGGSLAIVFVLECLDERNKVDSRADAIVVAIDLGGERDEDIWPGHGSAGRRRLQYKWRCDFRANRPQICGAEQINEFQPVKWQREESVQPEDAAASSTSSDVFIYSVGNVEHTGESLPRHCESVEVVSLKPESGEVLPE